MSQIGYREKCLAEKNNVCDVCGTGNRLIVHHINGDRSDNRLENLVPLCRSCHSTVHFATNPNGAIGRLQNELPESAIRDTSNKDPSSTRKVVLGLRVPKDMQKMIDELADEHGLDRSQVGRRLIRFALENGDAEVFEESDEQTRLPDRWRAVTGEAEAN